MGDNNSAVEVGGRVWTRVKGMWSCTSDGYNGRATIDEDAMLDRIAAVTEENAKLRAALAVSKDPCGYCQLPADEMAKCRAGFPGCARADDMTGCPEFGTAPAHPPTPNDDKGGTTDAE